MCGRYTFTQLPAKEQLSPEMELPLTPRYNVAPTQMCLVRPMEDPGHYRQMRWGLIPFWAKDIKIGYKMINARLETVLEKSAFRQPVRKRRVLVWADGFYEWKKTDTGKQPHRITLKDGRPFCFAGIADRWRSPEGDEVHSFTVLTLPPNELMAPIHDRMPVILTHEQGDAWLDPKASAEDLVAAISPYPSEDMYAYPVAAAVGNVRNESPQLIAPIEEQGNLFG